MSKIAVVVPTIRIECLQRFGEAWGSLFNKYNVERIYVYDGDKPCIQHNGEVRELESDLVYNYNDGVRNLGFLYIAQNLPEVEYIVTLDDDTTPYRDTIADHISALNMRVPLHWMSTASLYVRGIPYNVREEAEVVLSHGVWHGVADWDAPTQLVLGNRPLSFYRGGIPKGVFYPLCGMNIAFKRKMLPYMYYAPMGKKIGLDRFADIWCGIESKKVIDENNWAVVTGYSAVNHERASNVWKNLQKEAKGLELNENYGQDDYFKLYEERRTAWRDTILKLQS